jgi:hypothetical protein
VGSGRKLVLFAIGVGIAFVPGMLRAADSPDLIYRVRIANPTARVEWAASLSGLVSNDWEVTVTVDRDACEVSCAYRLKRDRTVRSASLAPPKIVVQVYSDGVSLPQTVSIDPSGLDFPAATHRAVISRDRLYMPARKLFPGAPGKQRRQDPAVLLDAIACYPNQPAVQPPTNLPLRI